MNERFFRTAELGAWHRAGLTTEQLAALADADVTKHVESIRADAEALQRHIARVGDSSRAADAGIVLGLVTSLADEATEAARRPEARAVEAALLLIADARVHLLYVAGEFLGLALGQARRHATRDGAKAALDKRHAPARDAKNLVLQWWAENGRGKMNKERAADRIVETRQVSEKRSTVRRWLRGA